MNAMRISLACALVLLTNALSLDAQQVTSHVEPLELHVIVDLLNSGELADARRAGRAIDAAFREDLDKGTVLQRGNLRHYTGVQRRAMLDAVVRTIIDASRPRATDELSMRPWVVLRTLGLDPTVDAPEASVIPSLVLGIYHQASDPMTRTSAIMLLGSLLATEPAEFDEIMDLLVSIAKGPARPGEVHPTRALDAIFGGCREGPAVARRLYESGEVENDEVRMRLRGMAMNDFPAYRFQPYPSPCA